MHDAILPFLRCPSCGGFPLKQGGSGITCSACHAAFDFRDGILDFLGDDAREVITPFQRIMQTPLIVAIYERAWRRIGYYLASSRSFDEELRTVLAMNLGKDSSRVLDLACGPGVFTRPLARQSRGVVVGLDLSLPMLGHARRALHKSDLRNITLVRASAFRLPFGNGAFTYVNCCGALHLFHDPDQALAEMRRVLAPGGHLCVQTTIRPSHSGGLACFLERFIRFGFFDQPDLERRIRGMGFHIIAGERHRISYTCLCR